MERSRKGRGDQEEHNHIDKTQVLQEARQCFMATSVRTKKLIDVLTKCIFILLRGERLSSTEATDLFFHMTRLFQYNDSTLRRLTYIGIKALSKQAENVYVVTSSLTNDVNSSRDDPVVRASALRALCQISDASTFTSIERYLKQSIVDKHPVVASAALSSLIRIASVNSEIVRRCTNEIQEALNSDSPMVQYHALALRYNSCKNDRLAVSRLISNCKMHGLKSPLATCLLIKIIYNYINDYGPDDAKDYIQYIKDNLTHRSDMVEYEAANALVSLPRSISPNYEIPKKSITAAIAHLRNFLTSSKPALRFAAVRTLNRLAVHSPSEVRECNLDLESLISQADCNRSIAILAITTLLKTGTENSVEKFLKQIGEFLSEIDDEFKVTVVSSVRQLCMKYPSKHVAMMDFLSNMLREEGGYAYKKAIVDTIINIILDNEETKEKGLEQLCEFIEDCEHDSLAVEVLNLLGREGPKMKKASSYLRYIANRVLLDSWVVACAAISALAKFGVVPELSESIKVALKEFSFHEDDAVMNEAVFNKGILDTDDPILIGKFIGSHPPNFSFSDLDAKLNQYVVDDCHLTGPFQMSNVAAANQSVTLRPIDGAIRDDDMDESKDSKSEQKSVSTKTVIQSAPPLNVFDEFDLGNLIKTTESTSITDDVSEFCVQCIKHVYPRHMVFQFNCTNTVDNMCLENVSIEMEPPAGFVVLASTVYPKLAFEETVPIYVCIELVDDSAFEENYFTNVNLKYKEPDSDDEDTFPLEDILIDMAKLLPADFLSRPQYD